MLDALPVGQLPPISFASRGWVCKDGSVIGWSLLAGEHRDYHAAHGTSDSDFVTRWRQWSEGSRIDFEERPIDPLWEVAVEAWIAQHADEQIGLPQ